MKVILYGASGFIGSRILNELLSRNHQVTGVVRDISKIANPDVEALASDICSSDQVAEIVAGSDAVISAYAAPFSAPEKLVEATKSLIHGLKKSKIRRLIVVGGAGNLEVSPGVQLLETPEFPAAWKPVALAHREAFRVLLTSDLDWTSFSPAALIEPGVKTGKYRLGQDDLVVDAKGESRISAEDYATALVDELENPKHIQRRFTIGY